MLIEQSHIVGEIASTIKKPIVVRSDPSVRTNENEGQRIIKDILAEAGLVQNYFDRSLGEVVLRWRNLASPSVRTGKSTGDR